MTYAIHANLENLDRGYHITYTLLYTKTLSALDTNLASSLAIHSFSSVVVGNELMHRIACRNTLNLCGCLLSSSIRTMSDYLNDNAFVEAFLYEKKNGYFSFLFFFSQKEGFFPRL
jgi:hypothetical protein